MDINTILIGGTVGYRDPMKFWHDPATGQDVPFVSFILQSKRVNGRGDLGTEEFRVTIWDISIAQEACLNPGTQVLLQGQLKSRRQGPHGRGILVSEITIKARQPGAITFGKHPHSEMLPVANLPDVLREMGIDLPVGLDQDLVARARDAIANTAPPVNGPTPQEQYAK
jgi:hypothetical protein